MGQSQSGVTFKHTMAKQTSKQINRSKKFKATKIFSEVSRENAQKNYMDNVLQNLKPHPCFFFFLSIFNIC